MLARFDRDVLGQAGARVVIVWIGLNDLAGAGAFYPASEQVAAREALNAWIRSSGVFDAVIDADRVLRDPDQPARLLPAYDSGDHLHPNTAGGVAVAGSIDLGLLR